MKNLHRFLKIFIFVQFGSCCGRILAKYINYARHRELYAAQNWTWYSGIGLTVLLTLAILAVTAAVYFIIGCKIKNSETKNNEQ